MTSRTGLDGQGRPPLTSTQRRAVAGADPATGEVRAGAATAERLASLGLVRRHGNRGAHYLTPEGHAIRGGLLSTTGAPAAAEQGTPGTPSTGFTPATGDGPPRSGERRAAAAAQAWRSLLEIRRLTSAAGAADSPRHPADEETTSAPADWERARPLHAVALALEAAGRTPSALDATGHRIRSGYLVTDEAADPGTVRVEWRGAANGDPDRRHGRDRLQDCADALSARGWDTERYTDSRRRPYLLATPRRRR